MIGRKKNKRLEANHSDNPWLTSRRTWNDLFSGLISSRQHSQIMAMLSILVALASVGGVIHIGQQSKFIPYIVAVDSHGVARQAGQATPTTAVDPRIVLAKLSEFISDARLVTPDVVLQRNAVFRVYSMLSTADPATETMNQWMNGSEDASPFKRAAKEMVSIKIESVLPLSDQSWQVEWEETVRDRSGTLARKPEAWRAVITAYVGEPLPANSPDVERQLLNNPMNIYVRSFSWSRIR